MKRRWLPRRLRIALGVIALLLLVALGVVWIWRVDLASDYIDRELARRNVQASYEIRRIGFGTQVLENLVIGDPRRPDLTAREVRVQILIGLRGPYVGLISARGVRMRGRIVGGQLDLGQVNRLLPPPSGEPFRLPDQRIDVADARLDLATPAGAVALSLEGRGNLSNGFSGQLGLRSARLTLGDCTLEGPVARFAVRVQEHSPALDGPLAMRRARCGTGLAAERPAVVLNAVLAPGLDGWRGTTVLRAAQLRASGNRLERVQGRLGFRGNAQVTSGTLALEAAQAAGPAVGAGAPVSKAAMSWGSIAARSRFRCARRVRRAGERSHPGLPDRVAARCARDAGAPLAMRFPPRCAGRARRGRGARGGATLGRGWPRPPSARADAARQRQRGAARARGRGGGQLRLAGRRLAPRRHSGPVRRRFSRGPLRFAA